MNDSTQIPERNLPPPQQTARALVTPKRSSELAQFALPAQGSRFTVATARGRLSAYRAGSGPIIALAHGWGGSSGDFNAFVPALLEHGFAVAAIDFSGQGLSEGTLATIPDSAQALGALQEQVGRFHGVIAYSLGCAITVEALVNGFAADRVVLISPPRRYGDYVLENARQGGWPDDYRDAVLSELQKLGVDTPRLDIPNQVAGFTHPALILHSDNDRILPIRFGEAVAQAWQGSRFVRQPGLGHRRILGDPSTVRHTVEFIASP